MAIKRTLVSFDWAVKNLLRRKANYGILEGFLTTLIGKKIKIKNIADSESNKETEKRKYNQVDIYFHDIMGVINCVLTVFLDYSKIRKVYSVNIVYFDLGVGKDYIYHGTTKFKGLHYNDELGLGFRKKRFLEFEGYGVRPCIVGRSFSIFVQNA
jgi:hypothetical protein